MQNQSNSLITLYFQHSIENHSSIVITKGHFLVSYFIMVGYPECWSSHGSTESAGCWSNFQTNSSVLMAFTIKKKKNKEKCLTQGDLFTPLVFLM